MNILELSEQELVRLDSLAQLRELGIDPYPAAEYVVTAWSDDIKAQFTDLPVTTDPATGEPVPVRATAENSRNVSIAGRVMGVRVMGKASFMELQDSRGRVQVYIQRDEICPGDDKDLYNVVFKKLLDIGDFVGVSGFVFRTKTGEISVHARSLKVLSKSLRPLPVVKYKDGVAYDKFDNPEQRYRQRYVDLIVNDGVKATFVKRAKAIRAIRHILDEAGYT
ncbi:MAG: OB-fold nucleic acid binding domain-containing protein, partial [Prevotella sp.]|nr:OB-fold nucleic acid binding domain-containing protein [Prevotella sp.]